MTMNHKFLPITVIWKLKKKEFFCKKEEVWKDEIFIKSHSVWNFVNWILEDIIKNIEYLWAL